MAPGRFHPFPSLLPDWRDSLIGVSAQAGAAPAAGDVARPRPLPTWLARADRPLVAGLIALAGAAGFVLLRLGLAAGGNNSEIVRAAAPYSHAGQVPRGLVV